MHFVVIQQPPKSPFEFNHSDIIVFHSLDAAAGVGGAGGGLIAGDAAAALGQAYSSPSRVQRDNLVCDGKGGAVSGHTDGSLRVRRFTNGCIVIVLA